MEALDLYFDGAARPNPGPAASAAVLVDRNGDTVAHLGRALGHATNNVAEWTALEMAMTRADELGARELRIFGDSQLVINQAFGTWTVGEPTLQQIAERVQALRTRFASISAQHIPAGKNAAADTICNAVLDGEYIEFDSVIDGNMIPLTYVVHVNVPAAAYADGPSRTRLRTDIANILKRGFPVATADVRRTAAHTVPVQNGLADLSFVVTLRVTQNAGAIQHRETIRKRLLDVITTQYQHAHVMRVCA